MPERFTLTILPDGRGLLAAPDSLTPERFEEIKALWENWKSTPESLFIFTGTVEHARTVELELDNNGLRVVDGE